MGNITTPFKASISALIAGKLVHALGMGDHEASYVADAAWMLLTAGITYAVPADFGSGLAARLLGMVINMKAGALLVVAMGLSGFVGCSGQQGVTSYEVRQGCIAAELATRACFVEADRRAALEAAAVADAPPATPAP